jgi:hypothetical protein
MDKPHPPSPEEFKTRVHLDLLTRILAATFVVAVREGGLTDEEILATLDRRLAKDQSDIDASVGKWTQDPALTALYAEEAGEVFDKLRLAVSKALRSPRGPGV